jgi:tRNA1Val (adenine37-N6)-methyltransferase
MSNPYFQFRQFTIKQDRCTMKVCTDSCILGAWTARRLNGSGQVLDIGSGTGLLSLMLAQKNRAGFDAIDLDPEACGQATENVAESPWSSNIHVINADARHYRFSRNYDFIIANPPFFESDLPSPSPEKNKARHADTLSLEELISVIHHNLQKQGAFSILLPFHRTDYFEKLALDKGFSLREKLMIRQTPGHRPFRSILLFARRPAKQIPTQELIIRDEEGNESPGLLELLADYYLR